jgi:isopentenyl-diphosphate delta-isomerase
METEYVVLVDEKDKELGTMEKLQAHREGKLHRAVSVIIFNSKKEMLLQKRAASKYHSAGLWSNACCSHPRPGEQALAAAKRRLLEEMGIQCELKEMFDFTYRIQLPGGLNEHELDHVFAGISDEIPKPDPDEVSDWKFVNVNEIQAQLQKEPQQFTGWFGLILEHINITK